MSEPNEKPTFSRFDQNLAFGVMVLACAAVTFIKLDELIGAVGLRVLAAWYGIGGAAFLLAVMIYFVFRWKLINFPVVLIACVIFVFAVTTNFLLLFLLVLPASLVTSLPAIMFPILIGFLLMIWRIVRRSSRPVSPFVLKLFTFFMLILCGEYLIANIVNEYIVIDRIAQVNSGKHHYFLDEHMDIFENVYITSYKLVLHECNRYAFNCRPIYESDTYSHGGEFVVDAPEIELQSMDKIIRLYVDDEVWFEHPVNES